MTRLEKCILAKKKGFKYNKHTGVVLGVKGNLIIKKVNGYTSLTIWYDNKRNYLFAHQFAWYIENNEIVDLIDHKNRIKTDNRICNLISTTKQLNGYNTNARGTSLCRISGRYESKIMIDGKYKYLGKFDTEQEAHECYLEYKNKLVIKLKNK